jgi:hypothetical protein
MPAHANGVALCSALPPSHPCDLLRTGPDPRRLAGEPNLPMSRLAVVNDCPYCDPQPHSDSSHGLPRPTCVNPTEETVA